MYARTGDHGLLDEAIRAGRAAVATAAAGDPRRGHYEANLATPSGLQPSGQVTGYRQPGDIAANMGIRGAISDASG